MKELVKKDQDFISSKQIAEATGKRHHDVLADIRGMSESAGITICVPGSKEKSFELDNQDVVIKEHYYKVDLGNTTRTAKEFLLNEMAAELLATGYDVKRRLAVLRLIRKMRLALESKTKIDFSDPDTVLRLAQNWKEEQVKRIEAEKAVRIQRERLQLQEGVIEKAKPKVDYYDEVLQSEGMIAISVIAKELNISAVRLNKFLYKQGIQYQCNGTWLLYSAYQDKGYTKTRTVPYTDEHGNIKTNIHTYWTEKGRKFIHDLWKKRNGRPLKLELN